ncbi:cross-pathway control protein A [Paracoccidioides lutzii Pb01]|uniref:Cross-pathway control protein A n=1 Tax=Paracoccidioides lutzii (strain ATCC MYA-826 / Pb01) TaxID=502779 RepID=C1GYE0_PARBA|nr:cross-pathway control protein A [Paracoccidioides lutzii Pb01]EEH41531.2 cross-pathway control protein A [Paracoccidioides lutzii Pb01]
MQDSALEASTARYRGRALAPLRISSAGDGLGLGLGVGWPWASPGSASRADPNGQELANGSKGRAMTHTLERFKCALDLIRTSLCVGRNRSHKSSNNPISRSRGLYDDGFFLSLWLLRSILASCLSEKDRYQSPFQGPLDFIAQCSSNSSLPVTIPPFDITSFNTDKLQPPCSSQPPSLQPPAQNTPHFHQDDFVLYPSPPKTVRQARHLAQRAPVSSSSTPRTHPQTSSDLSLPCTQDPQRHLYHPQLPKNVVFSGSLVQDPRVAKVISQSQGFSSSSSSNQSNPSGVRPASFYAASAPSSSPRSNRPPVPLFNNSAENISYQNLTSQQSCRRIMSTPSIPQGKCILLSPYHANSCKDVKANATPDFAELLDFPAHLGAEDLMSSAGTMDFTSINNSLKLTDTATVSPKDLMLDVTFPPSTSFTDISTPSFDSPGYFSQNTSPLFFADSDLAPGHEHWDSLFPNDHSCSTIEKSNLIPTLPKPVSTSASSSSPALKGESSSEGSPRPGRSHLRHSSISGVKPRHREKPLPPIEYDPKDTTAAKRARNTEAARKSRARKVELQMQMEAKIAELEASLAESRKREAYWKSVAEARE